MHRVRAAIVSGGASAYRLLAGKRGRARQPAEEAQGASLDPAIVARAGDKGLSRQERDTILHVLRDVESVPEDGSLAHWNTQLESDQPLLYKPGRRRAEDCEEEEPGLAGEMVPRRQSRTVDTRSEDRAPSPARDAVLTFRQADYPVRVVNLSSRGLMIESDVKAHIAEELVIRIEGRAPTPCFVRWIRDGRIGLGFREQDLPQD